MVSGPTHRAAYIRGNLTRIELSLPSPSLFTVYGNAIANIMACNHSEAMTKVQGNKHRLINIKVFGNGNKGFQGHQIDRGHVLLSGYMRCTEVYGPECTMLDLLNNHNCR